MFLIITHCGIFLRDCLLLFTINMIVGQSMSLMPQIVFQNTIQKTPILLNVNGFPWGERGGFMIK